MQQTPSAAQLNCAHSEISGLPWLVLQAPPVASRCPASPVTSCSITHAAAAAGDKDPADLPPVIAVMTTVMTAAASGDKELAGFPPVIAAQAHLHSTPRCCSTRAAVTCWQSCCACSNVPIGLSHGTEGGIPHRAPIGLLHGVQAGIPHRVSIGLSHGMGGEIPHRISIGLFHSMG